MLQKPHLKEVIQAIYNIVVNYKCLKFFIQFGWSYIGVYLDQFIMLLQISEFTMVDRPWRQLLLKNNTAEGIKWQDNVSPHRHKSFMFRWPTYLTKSSWNEEELIMTSGLMIQPIIMQCQGSRSCSYVLFHPLSDQETRSKKREKSCRNPLPLTLKSVTLALNLWFYEGCFTLKIFFDQFN